MDPGISVGGKSDTVGVHQVDLVSVHAHADDDTRRRAR
jgi:hypothetical protein